MIRPIRAVIALLILISCVPLASAKQSATADPRLAGNGDLSRMPSPDFRPPAGAVVKGYRFWPMAADPVLLGPVHGIPDAEAKQKTITGPRTLAFFQVPSGTSEIAVIRSYETEVQQAGGAFGYQCNGSSCGVSGSAVGLACGWLVGWFIKGENDPLNDQVQAARGANIGEFSDAADNTGFNDQGAINTAALPTECHFAAGLIPGNTKQGDRYVSVAVFNNPGTSSHAVNVIVDEVTNANFSLRTTTINADALAHGIQSQGHVALYGIYFDTDKSTPKAESRDQIKQIAAMLKAQPMMKVLIVGHTDNQGGYDYNEALSLRRAQALVNILTKVYGINPARLQPVGDGMTAPVATNDTDAGRALNRRVELVKE